MKLHEAPTITAMAKGIPLTPKLAAMAMAIGNIKTATGGILLLIKRTRVNARIAIVIYWSSDIPNIKS